MTVLKGRGKTFPVPSSSQLGNSTFACRYRDTSSINVTDDLDILLRTRASCHRDSYLPSVMQRKRVFCSIVSLLLIASGCCKSFDSTTKQENQAARAWVTESWSGQYDWTRITDWRNVAESKISKAETLLKATAILPVTASEAQEMVGESLPLKGKEAPYLLRAVGDAQGTFPLELVVRRDGTVWVGGGANSKCPVPMQRRPVVAWLDKKPERVYVTFYANKD